MLTVDGMIAKVQLNYDISGASYMYFFVPGVGTAVVSLSPMSDSVKVKNAFDGTKLTFTANGHSFELASQEDLVGKTDAYVHFDTSTVALGRTPRMGFGKTLQPPYTWPLSIAPSLDKQAHLVVPPSVPASMMPAIKAPKDAAQPAASSVPASAKAATQAQTSPSTEQLVASQTAQQQ
jgi:hypothetical protein